MPTKKGFWGLWSKIRAFRIFPTNELFFELFQMQVEEIRNSSTYLRQMMQKSLDFDEIRWGSTRGCLLVTFLCI